MLLTTKMSFALKNNLNVLLQGLQGCGKTQSILDFWTEQRVNFAYFNCPVIDVYEDIKGIPVNIDGKLTYLRPEHRQWENIECVFLDEPNRAHIKVVNSLYELIQFRQLNGVKLPALRCVWAAMNPNNGEFTVENVDQSFYDRFHLHVNVTPTLEKEYFVDKINILTEQQFNNVCKWWNALPDETRDRYASPRRVKYAIDVFNLGGSVEDVLPAVTSPIRLEMALKSQQTKTISVDNYKEFLDNAELNVVHLGWDNFIEEFKLIPAEVIKGHFPYNKTTRTQDNKKVIDFVLRITSHDVQLREERLCQLVNLFSGHANVLVSMCYGLRSFPNVVRLAADTAKQNFPALARVALQGF